MTKPAKHFANVPDVTEVIDINEFADARCKAYPDAGRTACQAIHRGVSRATIFAISGVTTSVLLAGTIFLSSPVGRAAATAETPSVTHAINAFMVADDVRAAVKVERDAPEEESAEARLAEAEMERAYVEAQAERAEDESAKAEAEAMAAEEQNQTAQESVEPHVDGESVTIALPTADADVYAEWKQDEGGTWWACFSTFNGTAVWATPATDGGWLFYAVTDHGLVQIQRVNESSFEGESGPGGISSHWTDTATNTVWY